MRHIHMYVHMFECVCVYEYGAYMFGRGDSSETFHIRDYEVLVKMDRVQVNHKYKTTTTTATCVQVCVRVVHSNNNK